MKTLKFLEKSPYARALYLFWWGDLSGLHIKLLNMDASTKWKYILIVGIDLTKLFVLLIKQNLRYSFSEHIFKFCGSLGAFPNLASNISLI